MQLPVIILIAHKRAN